MYLDVNQNLHDDVFVPTSIVHVDTRGNCYPGLKTPWYSHAPIDLEVAMDNALASQKSSIYSTQYAVHETSPKSRNAELVEKLHNKLQLAEHMRKPAPPAVFKDDRSIDIREKLRAKIAHQQKMRGQLTEELTHIMDMTTRATGPMHGHGQRDNKVSGRHWSCKKSRSMGVHQPMPRGIMA